MPEKECPSRLELERFLRQELAGEPRGRLQSHLTACARCTEWLAQAQLREEELVGTVDVDRLTAEVLQRRRETRKTRTPGTPRRTAPWSWLGGHRFLVASAAAASLTLVLTTVLLWPGPPRERREDTLVKGAASLRLYCRRDGRTFALEPGAAVRTGDALRFEVFSEREPHLLAISLRADGQAAVVVPFGGVRSRSIATGQQQLLEGSVVLDAEGGDELLLFLLSARPITVAAAQESARRALRGAAGDLRVVGRLDLPGTQLRWLLARGGEGR